MDLNVISQKTDVAEPEWYFFPELELLVGNGQGALDQIEGVEKRIKYWVCPNHRDDEYDHIDLLLADKVFGHWKKYGSPSSPPLKIVFESDQVWMADTFHKKSCGKKYFEMSEVESGLYYIRLANYILFFCDRTKKMILVEKIENKLVFTYAPKNKNFELNP